MLCYESILVGILVSFLLLFWLLEGASNECGFGIYRDLKGLQSVQTNAHR